MEKTSLEIKVDHRPSDCSINLKYGLEFLVSPLTPPPQSQGADFI